ncbi:outer membrane beta-barrel protein [Pseudomonas sp. GX19020]|uniref:outer membrane protein n=1 Tax=Pseudomonadota TaxID=1224 RepID=UPI00089654C0|nr:MULTISPECIES: outer membrane beta-barrel protein [Pseudomonadota]MCL4065430.1 outer membrane beta-barrel protein [Pseudomonas sp. GX19020]SEB82299.1 Opacity protein [Rhodobacter sp. 24-YEA-8]
MKRIAAILAFSAVAAPAFAGGPAVVVDEPVVVAPAPVVISAPQGNWAGFYGGASLGYGNFDGETSGVKVLDGDGAIGGVQLGYRWDLGNTVIGVEGAFAGSNIKDDAVDAKLKNKTDLKLQLGYDLGQSLIYATAGASWAKASIAGTNYSDNGWVAGLGYDYDLGNNWVVGAEYLYNKYDNFDNSGVDLDGSTFAIRANYRF